MIKTPEEIEAGIKAANEKYDMDLKTYEFLVREEEQRILDMECPVCKETHKNNIIITQRNGPVIYGGRNPDSKVSDYYVCMGCGIHYSDINKKKLDKPEEPGFYKKTKRNVRKKSRGRNARPGK